MRWKTFFATMVGLALLEAVLANRQSTGNVGAAESWVVEAFGRFMDPTVPLFSSSPAGSGTSPTTSTGSGQSSTSTPSPSAPPATTTPAPSPPVFTF